jgi:hypothetical protein
VPNEPPPTAGPPKVPPTLRDAELALDVARRRLRQQVQEIRNCEQSGGDKVESSILVSVITKKVKDIRGFNPLPDFVLSMELPYDELIVKIIWELTDNPTAAEVMGIEPVEGLVALLEAASLCEAKYGHYREARRLVYISMMCLLDCARALRLSSLRLLADAHQFCPANQCVSPGLERLSRNVPQYVKVLTNELVGKKRGCDNTWLLVFYSLCIQGHVRRALISLEEGQRLTYPAASANAAGLLEIGSADYLHTGISIFLQISAQNKNKLGGQIYQTRAAPSVYLGPNPTAGGRSWERWCEEGIDDYLGRLFQMAMGTGRVRPSTSQPNLVSCPGSDSEATTAITFPPPAQTGSLASGEGNEYPHDGCSQITAMPSTYSATSFGDSTASRVGWLDPSLSSLDALQSSELDGWWEQHD